VTLGGRPVAIVGAGYSTVGRDTGLSLRALTAEAVLAALADAGVEPRAVDGLASHCFPHQLIFTNHTARDTGIGNVSWMSGSFDGPAGITSVIHAAAAVSAGLCETAVAVRTIQRQGASGMDHGAVAELNKEFVQPFGGGHPTQWAAMLMRRMMHDYGWTEESFGRQMVAQRQFAELNPRALLRTPMTLDDYLAQRYVSKPLRVVDCDYPVDAGGAVVVTTLERARDLPKPVAVVEACAFGLAPADFEVTIDAGHTSPHVAAARMWSQTELKPADIDIAGLYDGFSPIILNWMEALGVCGDGEAADFVAEGSTSLGGRLPVNCDGGMANMGRIHGINHIAELLWQFRGECGPRQASDPEVGVASGSVGPFAGCLLMTKDR
jgi:acetyl-CoA acetyltransferase